MSLSKYNLSRSNELFERAKKVIPLASQTFSKSYIQYPMANAPRFIERGEGCYLFDVDGNRYIDLVSSLAAVILGYCDQDVEVAVRSQLSKGTIFSLPHELEILVAERIISMCPNAEQVRFGKNGSDATTGAIRLARAVTGRDRIAVCGYHGWHDWYISTTSMSRGIPKAISALTHSFQYNDSSSLEAELERYKGQFAAVILEPANVQLPIEGFLSSVRELAHRHGALFILDETITGFRYSLGGAQELYRVDADLVTYGKALANGFPISALAGRAEYMNELERIFFSFTFGGETLSLAASLATLNKLERHSVPHVIAERGTVLKNALNEAVIRHEASDFCSVSGEPCWFFLIFRDHHGVNSWELKTLFMQEMLRRGVLTMGSHNLNYCHDEVVIQSLIEIYEEVLPLLTQAVREGKVVSLIEGKALKPLFTVRKT